MIVIRFQNREYILKDFLIECFDTEIDSLTKRIEEFEELGYKEITTDFIDLKWHLDRMRNSLENLH